MRRKDGELPRRVDEVVPFGRESCGRHQDAKSDVDAQERWYHDLTS